MLRVVATNKEKLLTVKVAPVVLREFKIASELKGATMSALVHMFVVKTIREQKEQNPEAFRRRGDYDRPVIQAKTQTGKGKAKQSKG